MSQLYLAILVIGTLVLALGLVSGLLKRWGLPEPLIALLTGVLLGPAAFGLLNPAEWGDLPTLLEEAARLTLTIGLMGVALSLPKSYSWQNWRALAVILGAVMPLMWLSSSLLIYWVIGATPLLALLLGAIITPTDPIVAASIVSGDVAEENLPERLRHLLASESGFNDGLAHPLVMLPLLFMTLPLDHVLPHWLLHVLLWESGIALLVGLVAGYGAGRLLQWAEAHHAIEVPSMLAYTLALALFTLGLVKLVGGNGILAVFIAGVAFDQAVDVNERVEEEQVVEGINRFFTLPIFTLLGLVLPWEQWLALGWRAPLLVAILFLLRRLPALLLTRRWVQPLRTRADTLFLGWFGPIGISTIFYATVALRTTQVQETWIFGSLIATPSILIHGFTATWFTRFYGAQTKNHANQW